jgi:uncharacterized protein (TIGR03437 family)
MRLNLFQASGLALFTAVVSVAQVPVPLNALPSRVVGHLPEPTPPPNQWPNLVEGREFFSPEGIALDTSVSPPILYVSDSGNNRVLGWKNALSFQNGHGQPADLVIGQTDFVHTNPQGPGTTFSTGLNQPTGLLVDSNGNLYVADTNNNRILRFPKPFAQQNGQQPDLYIGQPNLNSRAINLTGAAAPSDQGLNLANTPWPINMAFDAQGNLWVVDGGNRRVLRFAGTDIAGGGGPLRANLEIGQPDFTHLLPAVTGTTQTTADTFSFPQGIAFDSAGRLYVSDGPSSSSPGRVLVFTGPFPATQPATPLAAARMMGVFPGSAPSQDAVDKTLMFGPSSIFFIGGKVGVLDSFSNRILLFDTFDKWPDAKTTFSPLSNGVYGQPDFHNRGLNGTTNAWLVAPNATSLFGPLAAVFFNNELYVADTANNRVVTVPWTGTTFLPETRVLGQDNFSMSGINLVEGREFSFLAAAGNGFSLDAGVALDETGDTPHLYVADVYNHRVLGFKDFRKAQGGNKADIVIGQPDFNSNLCNVSGNPDAPTASTLCFPTSVTVGANGELYVADLGNARVLRYPAPFANAPVGAKADLVLGQRNFTTKNTDPSRSTMSQPYGLAIAGPNGLFVSDNKHNRVLYFQFTGKSTFAAGTDNGRAADKVFGQQDFLSVTAGGTDSTMNAPRHISSDNEARLYVADTGNSRVLIFDQINQTPTAGATSTYAITGLNQPRGVFVNQGSSEIWIAEGGTAIVKRYPRYDILIRNVVQNAGSPNCNVVGNCVLAASNVLAVAQDQYGDLVVADATSRVGFYYPGVQGFNGGHFLLSKPNLSPGLLTALCSPGSACDPNVRTNLFGANTAAADAFPLPRTLGDVQVLFGPAEGDLAPVPLYYVSPSQINFVVPMNAPTSGLADIQILQPSTGRILAAGQAPMTTLAPAILQQTYTGKNRQAALINADGSVNGPGSPAIRGTFVSLYATGQGFVPGAPPDGQSPSGIFSTPLPPRINLGGCYLIEECLKNTEDKPKDQWLQYSGLSPSYPGVWQINFYVPSSVQPNTQVPMFILAGNSALSSDGTIVMYINVK